MKNRRVLNRLILCFAFVLIVCFAFAFVTMNVKTTYASASNTVCFASSAANASSNTGLIYSEIVAVGTPGDIVKVSYHTEGGTAIPSVDYKSIANTATLTIGQDGKASYLVAIKCLNVTTDREKLRITSNGETYGRYFDLVIDGVQNGAVDETKNSCKCYLTYESEVSATTGIVVDSIGGSREVAYLDDYELMQSLFHGGKGNLDGKKTWKSWQSGISFVNDTTTRWLNAFVNQGFATAYGSYLIRYVDNSEFHSSTDIYTLAGNKEMMSKYDGADKNTPGLYLYLGFEPKRSALGMFDNADKLNGRAMYLISIGQDPNDEDDNYIQVNSRKVSPFNKRVYWYQNGDTWYANDRTFTDSVFFKIDPYDGVLDNGLAIWNKNREVDIEFRDLWFFMKLIDDTAPTIVGEYVDDSRFLEDGKLRFYIRFSEPVYASKTNGAGEKRPLTLKINNLAKPFYANYVEGNYTDTLVYEVDASELPYTNITSIRYQLPTDDIGDLAYNLNSYKVVENNKLRYTDATRTFTMLNGSINYFKPSLTVDKESSASEKNIYNLMLSINADEKAEGTIFYEWSTSDTKTDKESGSAYKNAYVLTEEDTGSFGVTLVQDESAGIASGTYYLHALAISPYGLKDYKCFGPYKLDGNPPVLSLGTPSNELKTKTYELVNSKTVGAKIVNISFVVNWTDESGTLRTATRTLLENGERTTTLLNVLTENEIYQYNSNIDDTLADPLDEFILGILGEEVRLDANIYFVAVDSADNKSETNAVRVVYDKRSVFKVDSAFPSEQGYKQITDIATLYNAYDITNADRSEGKGISLTVQEDDRSQIVPGETAFSVTVNGTTVYTASSDPYTVVIGDLEAGFYELVPTITGETGGAIVNLVSNPVCFYLTDAKTNDTTNKRRTQENLVLTNKVFQIEDARYYYMDASDSNVRDHLYGATYDSVLNRYEGGSSVPTFSSSIEAKKYVRFMEYQDLYLVQITANMASLLNSSSGSTTYMKAAGETTTAQEGQLWIRYKRDTWTTASNAYGWAYYYYGNGTVSGGINLSALSVNLKASIDKIVNRIVSAGETVYLVQEGQIGQATGAPYLAAEKMHLSPERAEHTKTGVSYVESPSYEGDVNLYKNNVTVDGTDYPLATNLVLSVDAYTELYIKYGESLAWTKLNARSGQRLSEVLNGYASGVYTLREYGSFGVSEFPIYFDKTLPTLELLINDEEQVLDGTALNLSGVSASLSRLTNEIDELAYVAIYTYPSKALREVLYKDEVIGYGFAPGNYYVQVGDRAGNVVTYTLLLSTSSLQVTAQENESQTAVVVRVFSREESEIYAYEVYLNEELLTNEYLETRTFREAGIYRVVVSDIYGNSATVTVNHHHQSPKVNWYYLNDRDSYSKYDETRISKMIVSNDTNNSRVSNLYTSTLIRAEFDLNYGDSAIRFEMLDIDPSLYTYSESTGVLSVNALTSWRLRVWFEDHPENDHIYACRLDTDAPTFDASFMGKVFAFPNSPENLGQEDLAQLGEGGQIVPSHIWYDTEYKTATYTFFNGSVIDGSHISVKLFDSSGIRSYTVMRNGQNIAMTLDASGAILINSYGSYVISATDILGNKSTFSFVNAKEQIATVTMGDEVPEQGSHVFGHDPIVITAKYACDVAFLLETVDDRAHYVFNFDGDVVTYGSYFVEVEVDDEDEYAAYIADFVTAPGFSLSLNDDSVIRNRWYSAVENEYYSISVMFDDSESVVYKVESKGDEFAVGILASVGNGKLPNYYEAEMSQNKTEIDLYADGHAVEIAEDAELTYVAGTLILEESGISAKSPMVGRVEVAFSDTPSFGDFAVVYQAVRQSDGTWEGQFKGFTGEKDGYYRFIIQNIFGNVTTYTICKVESFTTIVTATYQDGTAIEYKNVEDRIVRSNKEIGLLVFSDNAHFVVNGEEHEGIATRTRAELVLDMPGRYEVRVVAANGIYQEYEFEIGMDYEFAYREEWLTGYNESALLKDQGYTNHLLSVELAGSVKYVDMVYNGETRTVLYDELNENQTTDLERLKNAIGKSGNGVYVVNFRDKYGDVVSKTIHYSFLPSIRLSRKTLAKQTEWEAYYWGHAMMGFYSNYQVKIETTSSRYEFKINGNLVSLDEPRILEFGNTSGNGTFEYKIEFVDEYGNYLVSRVILMRADVEIDKPKMKEVMVNDVRYTRDNVSITFAKSLVAYVSIDGEEEQPYTSGDIFYKDGNYKFSVEDIAGNRLEYSIIHKSVNRYTLTDRASEQPIVIGSVINNSEVVFRATDDSTVKTLLRNGKVLKDYESNTYSATGHYEMLIEDSVGNQSYAEFYIVNNALGEFAYNAPYGYEIKELWLADKQGNSKMVLLNEKDSVLLDENGDYVVLVAGKEIPLSFRFTVTIDNTPPAVTLDGVENGGTTARNVTIKGLKAGDQVSIYRDGDLVDSIDVTIATAVPEIETGGDYRIVVTNAQGVSAEYTFTRKRIANTATSIFLIIIAVMIMGGISIGLLYHTRHKTDA